jgi:hypothetical protein
MAVVVVVAVAVAVVVAVVVAVAEVVAVAVAVAMLPFPLLVAPVAPARPLPLSLLLPLLQALEMRRPDPNHADRRHGLDTCTGTNRAANGCQRCMWSGTSGIGPLTRVRVTSL